MSLMSNFKDIITDVVRAVQTEAAQIAGFDNGAIRLTFKPLCEEAMEWLGVFCVDGSEPELELVFPIRAGASHTVGGINCYSYTALLVASAAHAVKNGQGSFSGDAKFEYPAYWRDEEQGFARAGEEGSVCYEIDHAVWYEATPDGYDREPFLRGYVTVFNDSSSSCA